MKSSIEQHQRINLNKAYRATLEWYRLHAEEYADKIGKNEPAEIAAFESRLARNSQVLDLGCAAGRDTAFFAQNHHALGVDITPEFIALATKQHPDCTFQVADARSLPFDAGKFDALIIRSVLLHMPDNDIIEVLKESRRVAKPSALGFIRVKLRNKGPKYVVGTVEKRTQSNRLFNLFSKDEISKLLKESGVVCVELNESVDDDNPAVTCLNIVVRF